MQIKIFKSSLFLSGIFIIIIFLIMLMIQIYMCEVYGCKFGELSMIFLGFVCAIIGISYINIKTIIEDGKIIKKILYWKRIFLITDIQEFQIESFFFLRRRIKLIMKGEKDPKYLYPSPIDEFYEVLKKAINS